MVNVDCRSNPSGALAKLIGSITPTPSPTPSCSIPSAYIDMEIVSSTSVNRTIKLIGDDSNGGKGHTIVEHKWYVDSTYKGYGSTLQIVVDFNEHEIKLEVKNDCGNVDTAKVLLTKANTPTPTTSPTPSPIECTALINSHYTVINEFDFDGDNKISLSEKEEAKRQYLWGLLKYTDYQAILKFHSLKCILPDRPTPTPLPKANINAFRNQCMSNGSVKCSWVTIYHWLKNRRVSSIWWDLTQTERKSIAIIAIKNTLFYSVYFVRDGNDNCSGPTSSMYHAVCLQNAIIRTQIFGFPVEYSKKCYYKNQSGRDLCYYKEDHYGLPAYDIELRTTVTTGDDAYGHAICGIQIVNNMNSYKNFILFQYDSCDVQLGDWNFPTNRTDLWFRVYSPRKIENVRKTYLHDHAEFKIY